MKKYEYVRMKYKLLNGEFIHKDENGKSTYREIINDYAARGYRFVGTVPVESNGYFICEYDLVFEIEE